MARDVDRGLANATVYLDMFGRVMMAWIWLRQATRAAEGLKAASVSDADKNFYRGKIQAAEYYVTWELPQIEAQAALLAGGNTACFDMRDEWF